MGGGDGAAKKPHDLSPKYLGFSVCRAYMYVARYHWITFCIISKCQTFYSFSIYLKPSLHTYFSLFHLGFLPSTQQFHISLWESNILVSVLQNQFGRIYVLLTCKTFLARFVSFAALSWVYASQIVWNLTKTKKTNKKQTNKTKKSWSEQVT